METYATQDEFYAGRPDRERSREVDFGVMWRSLETWPHYRVTWVEATGEVIAVCLSGPGLGRAEGPVEVLGVVSEERGPNGIEDKLDGWVDVIHDVNSLGWVRERVR